MGPLHKIFKILALILALLGIAGLVYIMTSGDDAVKADPSILNIMMYVAYAILAIIVVMVLLFVLYGIFTGGNLKKTLISIGLFVLVVVVAYFASSGTEIVRGDETYSANTVKWVGAGLITFYILAAGAILAMILAGVKRITK